MALARCTPLRLPLLLRMPRMPTRNLAHIGVLQGKWDDALAHGQRATEADPAWGKGYFRQGEAHFHMRNYKAAMDFFAKARDAATPEPRAQHMHTLAAEADKGGVFFRQLLAGRDVACKPTGPIQQQIFAFAERMQNFMYLIGDAHTREVVAVDACWDVEGVFRFAEQEHVRITAGIATHYHFDHVGGAPPPPFNRMPICVEGAATLAARGLMVHVNRHDALQVAEAGKVPVDKIVNADHKTVVNVGGVALELLHTPGHTPGSQCVHSTQARLVLTGDTLFIGSCGRLDLPDCDKAAMYHSLQKVLAVLPPDTKVYPGHNYGGSHTTIAQEISQGLLAPMTLAQWLSSM